MSSATDKVLSLIPHLRRYTFFFTGNPTLADDLVQMALERAVSRREIWSNGTDPRLQLFQMLTSVIKDQSSTAKRVGDRQDQLEEAGTLPSRPEKDDTFGPMKLEAAVRKLPVQQRLVLLLVALEGFSYEEIADITGATVDEVRSSSANARAALIRATHRYSEVRFESEPRGQVPPFGSFSSPTPKG